MSDATIQARSSSATETRGFANERALQLCETGESTGRDADFPVGVDPSGCVTKSVSGIGAFIDHCRREHRREDNTADVGASRMETSAVDLFDAWGRTSAPLDDLCRPSWPSYCFTRSPSVSLPAGDRSAKERAAGRREEEIEVVDWDARIETPPPRKSRRIVVTFREGSYRRPRIVDDLED